MHSIWRADPGDVSLARHEIQPQILTVVCSLLLWSERGAQMKYAHEPRGLGSAACLFSSVLVFSRRVPTSLPSCQGLQQVT